MLFIFKRCKYNDDKILTFKSLSFLLITLFNIIIRFIKFIVKNESNKDNFNINYLKNILNKKNQYQHLKYLKKR